MNRLLTSAQMREADRRTIEELGLPGVVLMENAGAGAEALLWSQAAELLPRGVVVVAGLGNNGGDGFVIARRLWQRGVRVSVALAGRGARLTGDAAVNHQVFIRLGGNVLEVDGEAHVAALLPRLSQVGVVVDALFGTGLARPVTGVAAALIQAINTCGRPVLAVDLPSGVDADSGQVLGEAIQATWTVTFGAEKIAHRQHPGAALCGAVTLVPIGIPAAFLEDAGHLVARNLPQSMTIPPRPVDGHKGRFGHLLVVAGGPGKAGAAVLTALGAARTGPGLVTVAAPLGVQATVAAQLTEAMTLALPAKGDGALGGGALAVLQAAGLHCDALAMGPGLGSGKAVRALVLELAVAWPLPLVLDADALNALGRNGPCALPEVTRNREAPVVITPHPGEMARLTGREVAAIQGDRLACARQAAAAWGCWVVLKGAGSVIAAPDGRAWLNDTGNSGLAAGGSGDLLTGLIAGLLTQGWPVESAVRAGVWLHGAAADAAIQGSGPAGLMARDLLPHVQRLRNAIR